MATRFEIAIPYGTPHAQPAAEAALDLIDELEEQMTVYRDTSEVSRLNAAGRAVLEPPLFELLQRCAVLTRETGGAFDAAAGALVKCWGFHKRQGRIPTPAELNEAMARTGFRHVVLDAEKCEVLFARPGGGAEHGCRRQGVRARPRRRVVAGGVRHPLGAAARRREQRPRPRRAAERPPRLARPHHPPARPGTQPGERVAGPRSARARRRTPTSISSTTGRGTGTCSTHAPAVRWAASARPVVSPPPPPTPTP